MGDGVREDGARADGSPEEPVLDDTHLRPSTADGLLVGEPTEPDPDLSDLVIEDRYEIRRLLARGGMSAVYVAFDRRFEIDVAIKFLDVRKAQAAESELEKRFEGEAKVLARLRDPRILRPLSWGRTADGVLFMVTELLEGEPLDAVLRREGRLAPDRVASVLIEVCRALAEAHAAGVVHRDLKPGNLFLQKSRSGDETTRVLDFGIAKITQDASSTMAPSDFKTTPGLVMGTVPYMSPEQAKGEAVTAQSDIYSLGVVAYQCLTGRLPFSGEMHAVLLGHVAEPPPVFKERAPDVSVSPKFETLVLNMLAKKPEDRPQSASEVRRQLEELLGHGSQDLTTLPPDTMAEPGTVSPRPWGPTPPIWPRRLGAFLVAAAVMWGLLELGARLIPPGEAPKAEPGLDSVDLLEVESGQGSETEDPPEPDEAKPPEPGRSAEDQPARGAGAKPGASRQRRLKRGENAKKVVTPAVTAAVVEVTSSSGLAEGPANRRAVERLKEILRYCGRQADLPLKVAVIAYPSGERKITAADEKQVRAEVFEGCVKGRFKDTIAVVDKFGYLKIYVR